MSPEDTSTSDSASNLLTPGTADSNAWKVIASIVIGLLLSVAVLMVNKLRSAESTVANLELQLAEAQLPNVVTSTFLLNSTTTIPTQIPQPRAGQLHALSVRATGGLEYTIHLDDANQHRLWSWSTLSLNGFPSGRLSIFIGHDTLATGDYTLHLVNPPGSTQSFAFTLR